MYMEQWWRNLGGEVKVSKKSMKDPATKGNITRCWDALQGWMEDIRVELGEAQPWAPRPCVCDVGDESGGGIANSSASSASSRTPKAPPMKFAGAPQTRKATAPAKRTWTRTAKSTSTLETLAVEDEE